MEYVLISGAYGGMGYATAKADAPPRLHTLKKMSSCGSFL